MSLKPAFGSPAALLGWALVLATFAIDLFTPVGYAGGMPYTIPLLLGLWAPRGYSTACTIVAVGLTVVGFFLSPGDHMMWTAWLNRIGAALVLLVTGVGVHQYRLAQERLKSAKKALEGANDELNEREERLRAIVDSTIEGIIRIDERGIVRSANPAAERMFGWKATELVGQNVSVLMPSPHREAHDGYLKRYIESGHARIIGVGREATAEKKDGTTFPVHLSIVEVRTRTERFFTGVIRDITAEEEARAAREHLIEQLEQKNAELERFTYTVSHDLKSPLITIKGFVGTIERDARAGNFDRLSNDVGRIARAADRMKELLDDLLELSRVGRVANPAEDVPLRDLVEEVAEHISGAIEARGVDLVIAKDLPVVHGDRVRLHEVMQNLIENAVKFMGDQRAPTIEVGVLRNGETTIFVRDNGLGIDRAYIHKVFGLFERLDRHSPGTGIGLALVKRIVEVHGGRIWVESDGIGHGSTFFLTLPLAESRTGKGTMEVRR